MRYTQTPTPSNTPTPSITASLTPTQTPTGTVCPGLTPTATQTPTNTQTPTATLPVTPTQTQTQTGTPQLTPTQTQTQTPSGGITCIQIVDTVIAPVPQTGPNNFFGVNVALNPYPVSENVTVTGYIRDDGNPSNTYDFSLTIIGGTQSAETANNVLMTGPADTATIFVTGVTPTVVTYDGVIRVICGFEPDPNDCIQYQIENSTASEITWTGLICVSSAPTGGTIPAFTTIFTGCIIDGTLGYTGSPIISIDAIC